MFNEKQKEEFLDFYRSNFQDATYMRLKNLFHKTEPYEEEKGKDLCAMDGEELIHFLITNYDNQKTLLGEKYRLSRYLEWCQVKGYCKINYLGKSLCPNDYLLSKMESYKTRYYISDERYEEYVELVRHSGAGVNDLPILMSIYEGIAGKCFENLVYLQKDDIIEEGDGYRISLADDTCKNISGRLARALLSCYKLEEYVGNKRLVRLKYSFLPDSIWKSRSRKDSEEGMIRNFRNSFKRIKEVTGDEALNYSSLFTSGRFNLVVREAKKAGYRIKEDLERPRIDEDTVNRYQTIFDRLQMNISFSIFKYRYQDYTPYL
ncbi:phage lytic cycle repressor MrpR family protein [Qiania dongpingensis]|uniref:MrpR N-terminal core-binding domain-containing protein n=1 Tax=Qiania dongpingensis TaxID=2763669 RepID=A0A7G9G5I7_9FIRM|nr:hypothetical protein [Qiania dongpingensis]QNM06069.1 hypothetical protein H9Q78_02590 [Qiania dongpingensis]